MVPSELLSDPFNFLALCWPDIKIYEKQAQIIESVRDNDETFVPAGNQLGKDFISGFIALWFFCSRSPCRVVTTSVDHAQLKGVLWGEIRRFIQTSKYPLPIQVNDLHIRQVMKDGSLEPLSYLIGRVTKKGEGLLGHHCPRTHEEDVPRTLSIFDEASGLDTEAYEVTDTWSHRKLTIGNPYPCTNFFKEAVDRGDVPRENGQGYFKKVIRISAEDSPNVKHAVNREKLGLDPGNKILIPGVKDFATYKKHRQLWDPIRQCIGLDGKFYTGSETLLYPPVWRSRSSVISAQLQQNRAVSMGVDTAEGGDNTSWTVCGERGINEQIAMKTPDTTVIPGRTIALIKKYSLNPENVVFDRGGGGYQHAQILRNKGYKVRTVGFGEGVTDPNQFKRFKTFSHIIDSKEHKYLYLNRRAEMYGMLRLLLDPLTNPDGYGIPEELVELHRQMAPLPLLYDGEGRLYLPPKDKKPGSTTESLKDMLGCSPDELDSFVLGLYGMIVPAHKVILKVE